MFSLHLYSRLGQVEILMLLFIFLGLFFLFRVFRTNMMTNALNIGIALGLGLWTKETILGAIGAAIILILTSSRKRTIGRFLLGLAATVSPLPFLAT